MRQLLALLLIVSSVLLFTPISAQAAAITFDQCTTGNSGVSTTPLTFSTTPSSGATILVVGVYLTSSTGVNDVSTITYNGSSMTIIDRVPSVAGQNATVLAAIVNPTAGANNVVVEWPPATGGRAQAVACSYFGTSSGVLPSVSANNHSTAAATLTVGPIISPNANSWLVGIFGNNQIDPVTYTGSCSQRQSQGAGSGVDMVDSNGGISGSNSCTSGTFTTAIATGVIMYLPADAPSPSLAVSIAGLVRAFWLW